MIPVMGMAEIYRHEVYCGQCFEEFYGQEYCQNLRKDLEKLKDEFYDCDSHRFWREWVVPTVNLLRRLVHMGFPVRSKDFILVHLYNPVDSMAFGEMHFQVGRKAPGTLTLKFTKQNPNGALVIQPKTISNSEEMQLSYDPLAFLEVLRTQLHSSSANSYADYSNNLQVLVLMTDSCKLQRQGANTFLAKNKNEQRFLERSVLASREPTSSLVYSSTSTNPHVSMNVNHWPAPAVLPTMASSFHPETSIRPSDANYHMPWNFCVKNYVNYGPRTPTAEGSTRGGQSYGSGPVRVNPTHRQTSLAARQEPEEVDENLEINPAYNYDCSTLPPTERMAEMQRRMSDIKIWDAPPKGLPPQPQTLTTTAAAPLAHPSLNIHYQPLNTTRITEEYAPGDNTRRGSETVPILPRSLSNETNRLSTSQPSNYQVRRHSEPKITRVEEYCISKEDETKINRNSIYDKTSLTEEYVQDEQQEGQSHLSRPMNVPPQVSPTMPRIELNQSQRSSSRTELVDAYIGETNLSSETSSNESRSRTSSIEAYVGEQASVPLSRSVQSSLNHPNYQLPVPNDMGQKSRSQESLRPLNIPFVSSNSGYEPLRQPFVYNQPTDLNNRLLINVRPPIINDLSNISHSNFPSWGSHKNYQVVDPPEPIIPLVVQKINRGDYQSWDHLASNSSSISS